MTPCRICPWSRPACRLLAVLALSAALGGCQSLLPVSTDARIASVEGDDRELLQWRWPYEMGRNEWDRVRHARRMVERGETQKGLARLEELAEKGTPPAYYELAKMYHYGRGVAQDARRAEALYRQAVRINSSIRDNASYNMARLYLTRPQLGEHSVLAYHLLHQALEGERRAEALTWLGYLRAHGGEGVPVDPGRAERLYKKAAGLDSPEALRALAEAHRPGGFLLEDIDKANDYLTRYQRALSELIASGDVEAMLEMARLHAPQGLLPDAEKRRQWLERAAARGSADAMRRAGEMLLSQDAPRGVALLTRAAHRGSVPAMATLGELYLGDENAPASVGQDAEQASYWLEKAVAQNEPNAMVALGGAWLHGTLLEHKPAAGQKLLEQAAERQKYRAWTVLGRAFVDGNGVPRRPRMGLDYLERAEAKGELGARVELGVLWLNGVLQEAVQDEAEMQREPVADDYLIAPRPRQGEALLREAAAQGERNAMRHLAEAYLAGERLAYRPQEAEQLLQKAVALGDDTAMASLADAWLEGRLETENATEKALGLLKRAAEQGNDYAMVLLGRAYRQAPVDMERDLAVSERWLRLAVAAGHPTARDALHNTLYAQGLEGDVQALKEVANAGHSGAMEALGERYLSGEGVPYSATQAQRWLQKAAAAGRSGAAWQLGRAYLYGERLGHNASLALGYLEPLARAGHQGAQLALGRAWMEGEALPREMAAGAAYLEPLAAQGDITAARTLGRAYLEGPDGFRDPSLAERYLQQAVEGGDLYAHWLLGQALISEGDGLPDDLQRGKALLEAAAEQGHAGSQAFLGREYLSGERLEYRPERGARYLLDAAQAGHPDARTSLVTAYLRANGLAHRHANQEQARIWLDQVIQSWDAIALQTLYQLLVEAPPDVRQEPEQPEYLR